jgi:hypothetical protein
MSHSKLPWLENEIPVESDDPDSNSIRWEIGGISNPKWIAKTQTKEDADFIVRCVNSHDDLLAACKLLIDGKVETDMESAIHPSKRFCTCCGVNSKDRIHSEHCAVGLAELAITKAESL